ncbi:hypothetical protein BMF94_2884 [Rhodotorula taiwanensis]|uniref:F-box domain-containing protein n=1 Tax=Rhodotorula taiwanensis TaxID=741276 RepID=A0A2S5BBB2_9BASI|nr:hypothetical protein BMF94_2884 [Rhodotorula taiwanensis]
MADPRRAARMKASDLFDAESPNPGVDYLSKLPSELIGRIYKLAYAKAKPTEPLSRMLRPFYDEFIFRKVKATSDRRVKEFEQMLKDRPAIGLHVRDLTWEEEANPSDAARGSLAHAFSCMPSLHTLSFRTTHGQYLDLLLPTDDPTKSILPTSLVVLKLALSSDTRCDAYDPQKLVALGSLPHLTKLDLDFRHKYQSPQDAQSEPSELVLSRVHSLSVGLPKHLSSVNAFISGFPHLRRLTLTSHKSSPDFASALASVKSPAEVVELTLKASPKAGWRFPDELAALSSLAALNLAGKFDDLPLEAYQVFQHVPVRTLALGKKSTISGAALCGLVKSEKLTPGLETLRLDHLKAIAPDPDEYVTGDPQDVLAQFQFPEWTSAFTFQHLLTSLDLSRQRKIQAVGSAFEVIGIMAEQDLYMEEMGMWRTREM